MDDLAPLARRAAACVLLGLLAAFCAAAPVLAGLGEGPQEKTEAARVAKKMRKAQAKAHDAEEERDALWYFQQEVSEYAQLHARQLAKLGGKESVAVQKALADAIEAKRDKARPGDIFRPEVQPVFLSLIAEQLEGPDSLDARKAVLQGNPGQEEDSVRVVVRVNARYPPGAALSTVPPSLLATLPRLPAPLEYRFVGRDLILLDSVAGLIVDFLPAATPELAVKRLP